MTKEERNKLINDYATEVVDGMDIKTLCLFAVETIEQNMNDYTDEELIQEVTDYCPELLSNNK